MGLPNQTELLKLFSAFLIEAGLSAVSIKNYLSDLRHFFAFCSQMPSVDRQNLPTPQDVFVNINLYLNQYVEHQKASFTPTTTTNRRLSSIRRFSTFLDVKFGIHNIFTEQTTSKQIISEKPSYPNAPFLETEQTISTSPSNDVIGETQNSSPTRILSSAMILDQFKSSLEKEKKTHSTIKNYLSDLNHFFLWTANQTPFTTQNLVNILSETQLQAYVTYLRLIHTGQSVINRRQSSIKKLAKFCFAEGFLPENPFEIRSVPQRLTPLAWIERLSRKPKTPSNAPKSRLATYYDRYSSLPWSPYLNIALLILATTAMGIFAYNQIISGARPSEAITALTPPRRQLSFQGRLTDSGGTQITTAVSVIFRLFNQQAPGGTELYSTGTCSIDPDEDGIFNTLIGDGVCGVEIPSTVFTENRDVYLEIQVGTETLTPRQQIATVGYALNSETLQGYPASAAATINTVPVIDNNGDINIALTSPSIISTSGTFSIVGENLALQTSANSGGDIILQPDAIGSGQILAIGGNTDTDTFRVTNSNLTTGSLISGYVGSDLGTGRLLSLTAGSAESDRFWVAVDGTTSIQTATSSALTAFIINQNGSGDLISASVSGSPVFTVTREGNVDIAGDYLVNGSPLTASNWQRTSGSLAPLNITDSINIGAIATGSALVHLAGTAGENSFVNTGNFGVGTNNPGYTIDVGGDVNLSGALRDNGSAGNSGQILSSTGTGIAWIDFTGSSKWQRNNNVLSPLVITDSINLGSTATVSATVHLSGFTGENSFINTGSFGIGLTNPAQKLDVVGNVQFSGALMPNGAAGSSGQFLTSGGAGVPPTWTSTVPASSVPFSGITSGTNTTAAMVVGAGATLDFTSTGTINASSLLGGTWAAPGTIGSGTPNTGAFTTLTSSGNTTLGTGASSINVIGSTTTPGTLTLHGATTLDNTFTVSGTNLTSLGGGLSVTGYATVSGSLAVGYTSAPAGPGHAIFSGFVGIGLTNPAFALDITGDMNLTGALNDNGDPGTPGQILSSTGTGIAWIDNTGGTAFQHWQRNSGALSPTIITDAINLGNIATASAVVHLAGVAGDDSFINGSQFGLGLTNPAYTLDINGDMNLTGALYDNGDPGTPGQILSSTGTGIAWIDNTGGTAFQHWQRNDGVLSPTIITDDVAIGGTATASALFKISGTTGAATSSSTLTFRGPTDPKINILNGENFGIQTSPGGDAGLTERLTILNNGNVGIGVTNPAYKLDVSGTAHVTGTVTLDSLTANRLVVTDASKNLVSSISSANLADSITDETGTGLAVFNDSPTFTTKITVPLVVGGTAADSSLTLQSTSGTGTTDFIKFAVGSNGGTEAMRITNNGNIGIGTTAPLARLDIRAGSGTIPVASMSGSTTASILVLDQSGSGDIFTASSSGETRFTISNTGVITTSLGTGIVQSDANGVLTSSTLDLASGSFTGILPIANGGTNNDSVISPYVSGKFLAFDGTRFVSTIYDSTSFNAPLTFSNGLTRTGDIVTWGGTLTGDTTIDQAGFDVGFFGTGNFGIGASAPTQKLDVAGFFVVDTTTSRVGIGTTAPAAALDIAGATSTITNTSGDITLNAASGLINFSGDSLTNFLNATASGQIRLGNFTTAGTPTANGTGSMIYNTDAQTPQFWNGTAWQGFNTYFNRNSAGFIYPTIAYDSLHIGGTPSASSSALIRLSTNNSFNTFFANPVAIGFTAAMDQSLRFAQSTALQLAGDLLPKDTDSFYLGDSTLAWKTLYLSIGINDTSGTQLISIQNKRLTGGTPWNIVDGVRIGDTSNTLPGGVKLYVSGAASISGTLGVVGNSSLIGDVTVGGGTGKIDVGTVDPPFTINGEKYGTYMAGMIGIKEEVMGKVTTSEYISGLGYRALLDLDGQPKGSDLWLFSKTTNLKTKLDRMAVLLTATGQGKTWYEIDEQNKILAIYSSTPSDVIYRLTAPRFDEAKWANTRTGESIGFVINDPDTNNNIEGTGLLTTIYPDPEILAQVDGTYKINIAGKEVREESSFFSSIIANLKVGTQVVTDLVTDNLIVRTKLVSPIADIDQLKVNDATISGTLYADSIKSKTVDNLTAQLNLLDEKYSTASAILSDLQAKYTSYDLILGSTLEATVSGDPLALSPLATTSATIPSDLALESINVHTILANDIMANGAIFAQSLSSFDSDLFIQPTGDKPVHILANLMTLYPDGKIVVNGDLLITGTLYANALDTRTASVSGTLALGRGELATDSGKLIAIFDDQGQVVGSVDASGSANFGQLVTGGLIIASGNDASASVSAQTNTNTTIGTATIATGSAEVQVANSKVTDHTLIYITPISDTENRVLYVKSKQAGVGFTVAAPSKANQNNQEISFNYWLVQTK